MRNGGFWEGSAERSTREMFADASQPGRIRVMYAYAFLAVASLAVFGGLHIFAEDHPLVGYLELAGATTILLITLGLKVTGNLPIARFCFLLTLIALLVVMLTSGGIAGTGIFWCFMLPVAAFFLAGKREGLWWMAAFLLVLFLLWIGAKTIDATLYYNDEIIRQLAVTLVVVSIGLFVYQRSRETWEIQAWTSQNELRAYLRQMTALHEKVDHAKSEFVTLASHQLRTPISAIGWFSEMLLSGDMGKLNSGQKEYVQGVYDSNRRLGAIVDSMLLVSSLELGDIDVHPEPIDLVALARKVLKEERKKHEDKQLVVTHEYAKDLPKINLDPHITKQILQIVFSNALKYTPNGGEVKIFIKVAEKLTPTSKGSVMIRVTDTGYGIPKDEQKNVFAKLFRAANIKTKDVDGTGLGLYIVKALMDQIGGRVAFQSEENKGSTFDVILPLEGMVKKTKGRAAWRSRDIILPTK